MNIPFATGWFGAFTTLTGDGAAVVTGDIIAVSSGIGTGSAKVTRRIKATPGLKIKVDVLARRISGADATSGQISIDFPTAGTFKNGVRVTSRDWQNYTVSFTVPPNSAVNDYIDVVFGVYTADGGQIEYAYPTLDVSNSIYGSPTVHSCGLITMTSGVPTLSGNFNTFGIRSLSYTPNTLTLTLDPSVTAGRCAPLFFAQLTPEPGTNARRLQIRVGQFDRTAGTLVIQFVDTTTGTLVDATAYGLFYFQLIGLY